MCYTVTCSVCGKTTWDGCGQHVDSVMAGVPSSQRCRCEPEQAVSRRRWNLLRR